MREFKLFYVYQAFYHNIALTEASNDFRIANSSGLSVHPTRLPQDIEYSGPLYSSLSAFSFPFDFQAPPLTQIVPFSNFC